MLTIQIKRGKLKIQEREYVHFPFWLSQPFQTLLIELVYESHTDWTRVVIVHSV